ncbi:MAG: hypothetical protein QME90_10310 [Thermodesulfobacteriota bacterium]|nr:hypothetical protein [Thermodesulfobacteriota bacterium]
MKRIDLIQVLLILFVFKATFAFAGDASDFLILNDISGFKASKNPIVRPGPGMLAMVDHFHDHDDVTYKISYFNFQSKVGPEVQVTQHAGTDSDRWLLHELDTEFRHDFGKPSDSFFVKTIDGNTIFALGIGGWDYRWLSGNKVIVIEYIDLEMKKPEPMEVVKAYLAKHPSTLPMMTLAELRRPESKTKWIKDEMERRLWLCEKWFLQLKLGEGEIPEALKSVVKHMEVFLIFREKYFGVNALEERKALLGYLETMNGTGIKNKLPEYRTWWNANKSRHIVLP